MYYYFFTVMANIKVLYVKTIVLLSRVHYVEYLCTLIFRNKVEPVSILDVGELKQIFTRSNNHFMPKQRAGEYEFQYKRRLAEVIKQEIPLDSG